MIIKEVVFSYIDRKYGLGPYVEFFSELDVPSLEYDDVVKVIEDNFPIKIVLFAIILIMVVIYFVVASKCKNMTDDE